VKQRASARKGDRIESMKRRNWTTTKTLLLRRRNSVSFADIVFIWLN